MIRSCVWTDPAMYEVDHATTASTLTLARSIHEVLNRANSWMRTSRRSIRDIFFIYPYQRLYTLLTLFWSRESKTWIERFLLLFSTQHPSFGRDPFQIIFLIYHITWSQWGCWSCDNAEYYAAKAVWRYTILTVEPLQIWERCSTPQLGTWALNKAY